MADAIKKEVGKGGERHKSPIPLPFPPFRRLSRTLELNPFDAKFSQKQISTKCLNVILQNFEKQRTPCVSTARELSFEWSHHRISFTDSKVRVTMQNVIKDSGSERVKEDLHGQILTRILLYIGTWPTVLLILPGRYGNLSWGYLN